MYICVYIHIYIYICICIYRVCSCRGCSALRRVFAYGSFYLPISCPAIGVDYVYASVSQRTCLCMCKLYCSWLVQRMFVSDCMFALVVSPFVSTLRARVHLYDISIQVRIFVTPNDWLHAHWLNIMYL